MSYSVPQKVFAQWCGVSQPAVSKLLSPKGKLHAAKNGTGVDVSHPVAREYLADHDVYELPDEASAYMTASTTKRPVERPPPAKGGAKRKEPAKKPTVQRAASVNSTKVLSELSDLGEAHNIEGLEDMTLREIVLQYGSVEGFKRFLETLKTLAEVRDKEVRIAERRGELIDRTTVGRAAFALVDTAFSRLVNDVPQSLARKVVARCKAGGAETLIDVQSMIATEVAKPLQHSKISLGKLELSG